MASSTPARSSRRRWALRAARYGKRRMPCEISALRWRPCAIAAIGCSVLGEAAGCEAHPREYRPQYPRSARAARRGVVHQLDEYAAHGAREPRARSLRSAARGVSDGGPRSARAHVARAAGRRGVPFAELDFSGSAARCRRVEPRDRRVRAARAGGAWRVGRAAEVAERCARRAIASSEAFSSSCVRSRRGRRALSSASA